MSKRNDKDANEVHGFLSVLLITLITMEEGPPSFSGSRSEALDGEFREIGGKYSAVKRHDCSKVCCALIRIDSVRSVLLALYAPQESSSTPLSPQGSKQRQALEEWKRLQSDSLEFHRHGSTSFILRGLPEKSAGRQIEFALKCVLLPYANLPVIASKTESYATDHNSLDANGHPVERMVQVWASTTRWILMDFVAGVTLSEETENIRQNPPAFGPQWRVKRTVPLAGNVRLDLILMLGLPLLEALSELHRAGKQHEDLSPTNIIVRRRGRADDRYEYDVTFIDFGRNYLYTRVIGGHEGPEGLYVAPEVRSNEDDVASADLYSLGRILIALGDVGENRDGTIPDRFYGQAPLIARVIEDLTDENAERRLLIFGAATGDGDIYSSLRVVLKQELDVTQAELVQDSG